MNGGPSFEKTDPDALSRAAADDMESSDEDEDVSAGSSRAASAGEPPLKMPKKTKGRVKIKMEFIDNKLRRYTTFSKRKTGIMKKVGAAVSFLSK
jgi:serum response factor